MVQVIGVWLYPAPSEVQPVSIKAGCYCWIAMEPDMGMSRHCFAEDQQPVLFQRYVSLAPEVDKIIRCTLAMIWVPVFVLSFAVMEVGE